MSEDLDVEIEIVDDTPEAASQEVAPNVDVKSIMEQAKTGEEPKKFDPKTDKVDFSTPEQQAKFNYMYKQVKSADTRNQMLLEFVEKQQAQLDAIQGRFTQEESRAAEAVLLNRVTEANDEGDTEALTKAIDDLVKFRTDQQSAKPAPVKTVPKPPEADPDYRFIQELATETDENGQALRPWLNDSAIEPQVLKLAEEIALDLSSKNPDDPYLVAKVMQRLDAEMNKKYQAPKRQTRAPDPMGGSNLTQQVQRATIKLSSAELDICKKLRVDPKQYYAQKGKM